MPRSLSLPLLALLTIALARPAAAQSESAFTTGPLLQEFGPAATVPNVATVPQDMRLRVRFDVSDRAPDGELNRSLVTAARFLNMHARAGVEPERMQLALVIHGRAVFDVLRTEAKGAPEANAHGDLVAALREQHVQLFVCGQSAAYYGVSPQQLLPGVQMSLSAMTAHALLAAEGFELNPF